MTVVLGLRGPIFGPFSVLKPRLLTARSARVDHGGMTCLREVSRKRGQVFVPLTPAIMGPFTAGRLGIGGWMLLFAALGHGLTRLTAAMPDA
jgi:hypothetical protein